MEYQDLLTELGERLPELEWKMRQMSSFIPMDNIPKGLFRCQGKAMTTASCLAEIKEDIRFLNSQVSGPSAHYVAALMRQKVNVLVFICQKKVKDKDQEQSKDRINIQSLSTRKQWVQALEEEIQALELQKDALLKTLSQMEQKNNIQALLKLRAELGALEGRLTLAQEKFQHLVF